MTRWVFAVAGLAICPGLVAAQSLGDAAKKENDRRDKLRKAGVTSRTFTAEDLATTKGRLANDPREPTAAGADGEAPKREATASRPLTGPPAGVVSDDSDSSEKKERYWRARAAEARGRLEDARRRNDVLQRMIHLGQPAHYDANVRRVIYSIHQMKSMADAAAGELAAAEAALESLLEEGRRAGAQPGWLR